MTLGDTRAQPAAAVTLGKLSLSRPDLQVITLILGATLARLVMAQAIGLGIDESYMVAAGRRLQLSYYDHPPLSWWLAWGAARLFGSEAAPVVRLPFILLFVGSTWLMYRLAALLFGSRAGLLAAVIFNLVPVFTVSTASWVLPDGPLTLALLGAALCLAHALFVPSPAAGRWWLSAGFFGGLALLAKYHAVFLFAGVALFLLTAPAQRGWLRRPWPYAALGVAALLFLPVVVWNVEHGWASFLFQGGRAGVAKFRPWQPLINLGGQAAWLMPLVWLPLFATLVAGLGRGPRDERGWFLCCLGVGPVAFFTLLAAWSAGPVLFHWAAPGYLMLIPLLGAAAAERLDRRPSEVQVWLSASAILLGIAVVAVTTQVRSGWIQAAWPGASAVADPTVEALDWAALRPALAERGLLDRPHLFIAATRWHDAGKLDYALGGSLPVLCLCADARQYGVLRTSADYVGDDALIVTHRLTLGRVQTRYGGWFGAIEALPPVTIERHGRPALELSLFLAHRLLLPFEGSNATRCDGRNVSKPAAPCAPPP